MTDSRAPLPRRRPVLEKGTRVEVRNRFDGGWVRGYEVADREDDHYRVMRLADGEVLPVPFAPDDVRRERTRQTWWV